MHGVLPKIWTLLGPGAVVPPCAAFSGDTKKGPTYLHQVQRPWEPLTETSPESRRLLLSQDLFLSRPTMVSLKGVEKNPTSSAAFRPGLGSRGLCEHGGVTIWAQDRTGPEAAAPFDWVAPGKNLPSCSGRGASFLPNAGFSLFA